jgi:hypothetical protein
VLVKSCQHPSKQDLPTLTEVGVVDATFAALAARHPAIALSVVYAADAAALRETLAESI